MGRSGLKVSRSYGSDDLNGIIIKIYKVRIPKDAYASHNDEKSIVKFAFSDPWTIPELTQCERLVRAEISQSNHIVDAIFDVAEASILPQNSLSYFASSLRKGETIENEGVTVVYGANMFVHTIGSALQKMVKSADIYFTDSLEEADAILVKVKQQRNAL